MHFGLFGELFANFANPNPGSIRFEVLVIPSSTCSITQRAWCVLEATLAAAHGAGVSIAAETVLLEVRNILVELAKLTELTKIATFLKTSSPKN